MHRKTLQALKTRKLCHSALWVSFSEHFPCSHCMRLTVEGVTIEGHGKLDRNEDVDFEVERQQIFQFKCWQKCVAQNFVFRKSRTRIIRCFFSILENVAEIF